jgi:hypothetical protein
MENIPPQFDHGRDQDLLPRVYGANRTVSEGFPMGTAYDNMYLRTAVSMGEQPNYLPPPSGVIVHNVPYKWPGDK